MAFKNAVKILFHIFGLLWVLLLFYMVIGLVIISLAIAALLPLLDAIKNVNLSESITELFGMIISGDEYVADGVVSLVAKVEQLITIFNSPSQYIISYLFIVIIVGVLARFLLGLGEIPIFKVIEGYMSSNMNERFLGKFISNLGRSCKVTLTKMLFVIPYDLLAFFVFWLILNLWGTGIATMFVPFFLTSAFILFSSLKFTFLSFWVPEINIGNKSGFDALKSTFKLVRSNFNSTFSSMVVTFICITMINIFFGLFTFGVGLIVTIPLSLLFIYLLDMTMYYNAMGKRYYIDDETVYNPPSKNRDNSISESAQ